MLKKIESGAGWVYLIEISCAVFMSNDRAPDRQPCHNLGESYSL